MQKIRAATVAATMLSITSFTTQAADFGLGAGVTSDEGGTIYIPIDKGKLRIEPEISFSFNNNDSSYSTTTSYNSRLKSNFISVGAGIYYLMSVSDHFQSYVGSSLGYLHTEATTRYPNSPSNNSESKSNGFFVAPTFGSEYFFTNRFSIGLDISLQYRNLRWKDNPDDGSHSSINSDSFNTRTRTMLRYYFQ